MAAFALAAAAAPARADYAVGTRDGTYLIYKGGPDGDAVLLATCDEGTDVFTRASCRSDLLTVDAGKLDAALQRHFGASLPALDQRQRDAWVNLQQVDARLLELVAAWPESLPSPTTAELNAADHGLATTDAAAVSARDQIARMETELAATNDAETLAQLAITRLALTDLLKKAEGQRATINALRQRYADAHAQADSADYKDLVGMRKALSARIESTKGEILRALDDRALGATTAKRVADLFVWTSTEGHPLAGASQLFDAYLDAEQEMRTWRFTAPNGGRQAVLRSTRAGLLDEIECSFPVATDLSQSCDLALSAPNGAAVTYDKDYPNRTALAFNSTTFDYLHDRMNAAGFYQPQPAGFWQIAVHCTQPVPAAPATPTTCHVRLKR